MSDQFHPILFFDGICSVCNRVVDFVIKRDSEIFLFAPLQGETAKTQLAPQWTTQELRTIVLLDEAGVHTHSTAVIRVLRRLGGIWALASILLLIPRKIRDIFYEYFAAHRYQWFGKKDTCRIPTPEERRRFLN